MSLILEQRKTGLGGTDAAAVLGYSPWRSAFDVWLEKTGQGHEKPQTPAMHWGNVLEPVIADEYERVTGTKLWNPEQVFHDKEHDFLLATPDRLSVDRRVVFEAKTVNAFAAREWGPAGSDMVPAHYLIQCLHYLMVLDAEVAHLGALIGGSDYRIFVIHRDRALEATLRERLVQWWRRHIIAGAQPPIAASDATADWLLAKYPQNRLPLVKADDRALGWGAQLMGANAQLEDWGARKDEAVNNLKAIIGDAEGIEAEGWRATWRAPVGSDGSIKARRFVFTILNGGSKA